MSLKIAVIIPDRNDRPALLRNCLRMINQQTVIPNIVLLLNEPSPFPDGVADITWRYKKGYDQLRGQDFDCILFMENDDFYRSDYIESITREWDKAGRPELFGPDYTIYYHIKLRRYGILGHRMRSSAMSTLIVPDLNIDWGDDRNPFTDSQLWMRNHHLRKITFKPQPPICIGIKHGIGMCGGRYHVDEFKSSGKVHTGDFNKFDTPDTDLTFLSQHMDLQSLHFYTNLL